METYDVVVVGGGPAGAISADELAQRSFRVALLEKDRLPRYKACGGVVAPHVENILDFSIAPVIERRITKLLATIDLASPFVSEAPRPWAYMVMRDTFDHFLVKKAAKSGAHIYQEAPLKSLEDVGGQYLVSTPDTEFRTTYIIGADGANSTVRKLLGVPSFQRLSVAIEREIKSSRNLLDIWNDTLALDFGHLQSGYAWVFPKATNFSVGAGGPKAVTKHLRSYYDMVIDQYGPQIGNTTAYIAVGHYLPIRVPNETIVYGRTLLVGDAAGLIEPMTGEGIYYAIRSAQLAAETIVEAHERGVAHLTMYQRKVDREIQPELQVSKACLFLLDLAPRFLVPRLLKQSSAFWSDFTAIFRGEKTFQDFPKQLGYPGTWLFSLLAKDDLRLYRHVSGRK